MTSTEKHPAQEILPQYLYNIGDHVSTDAQGVTYFGYVIDRRPYEGGGNEYLGDFYSYALGRVWVVEWRLASAPITQSSSPDR